jgi:sec-independent protein translocase protein TatB
LELLVILLLALVVFGPGHLPQLARTLGLWTGRVRGLLGDLNRQLERELAADEMRKAMTMARETGASGIEVAAETLASAERAAAQIKAV